jgi:SAM-dependent methyltransferase
VDLEPSIQAYYEQGTEARRLFGGFPSGPLELARTKEIVQRRLPEGSLAILDVGGGPGIHAAWLAQAGHRVHVVDPIQLHVDQARARPGVTAELGDARRLMHDDASFDVVLLLGPLYHLVRPEDRLRSLGEARRVLRTGGLLFAAAISRFAALLDLLVRADALHEPGIIPLVEHAIQTGVFDGSGAGLFTTAYFHRPPELKQEVTAAGFHECEVVQVEGPGFMVADFERRWADDGRREAMLHAARLVESEPEMMGAASHLMAVARAPG